MKISVLEHISKSKDEIIEKTISNVYSIVDFLLIRPGMLWQNGVTYFCGVNPYTLNNNRIRMFSYNHFTTMFLDKFVGDGTTTPDSYNHPQSWMWLENGYIYTGQTDSHNAPINVYKSNSQDTINDNFAQLTDIPSENAYPKLFKTANDKVAVSVRKFQTGLYDHDLAINLSNAGIEGTFTMSEITKNDSSTSLFWYYNQVPVIYGKNEVNVLIGNLRASATVKFFAHAILVASDDFQNYNNYDNSYSNDLAVDKISNSEIDTYYTINGSQGDLTQDLGYMTAVKVDDVLYAYAIKSGTTDAYIFKIDFNIANPTVESVQINIPNLTRGNGLHEVYLYYNGANILLSCLTDDGVQAKKEICSTPMDLSSFSQQYTYNVSNSSQEPIVLPENLDVVTGEYLMHLISVTDQAYFYLTKDKFYH